VVVERVVDLVACVAIASVALLVLSVRGIVANAVILGAAVSALFLIVLAVGIAAHRLPGLDRIRELVDRWPRVREMARSLQDGLAVAARPRTVGEAILVSAASWTMAILALAAVGLVYGSLYAFRAPDFRGVVAYSSLAQSGLIVLGLFANNDLGFDGAVLQMVNLALVSASLFLLAGMIERRTSTGEFRLIGGMARGRPALATTLMIAGIVSLAVPLSTTFAGEFLILAGVFQQGWGWAVVGAVAIVLAAMYMLRLISAALHQDVGSAVADSTHDLRIGELAVVVPLVACLVGLSAWPNLISGRAFGGGHATVSVRTTLASPGAWTRYTP
jgi:formate hydrogenlyase subunit 3/multisubunit Na+/H+ antiporter MnhD subunit